MPFRIFALNRWQLTSFCDFPWYNHHQLESPKAKCIVWLQIYFCFKNVRKEIPLKQFSEHIASKFIVARNEG